MPEIRLLPKGLANLIAAGEVVERPASAVKELVENSFDAGAEAVTVEIRDGGMTYMRVTDDGCGIPEDQISRAFLRHATSKLPSEEALEAIATLGFRGEALAAISSVSEIEIISCTGSETEASRVLLDCGTETLHEPSSHPKGTTIFVRNLFRNTPARQKFMKTDRAESSAITETVRKLALSRPDISVQYIRDNVREIYTPGDHKLESCVYAVLGREFILSSVYAEYSADGISARGFVSSVEGLRGNRNMQYFFINGRCVKSRVMQAALEAAYRNKMLPGRFPACAVWLEAGYSEVDVNVHPAKTEVRFLYEKRIFDAVFALASAALEEKAGSAAIEPDPPARQSVYTYSETSTKTPAGSAFVRESSPLQYSISRSGREETQITIESVSAAPVKKYRVLGEILKRYIVTEADNALVLIDKHAAHERILFDKLKADNTAFFSQLLITPIIVNGEGAATLIDNAELLGEIGYEIEPFGFGSAAVRAVPSDISPAEAEPLLDEIAETLRSGREEITNNRGAVLAGLACKAAIKSGALNDFTELDALAARVVSGEIRYCPHGRPVSYTLTQNELDKIFRRIV